MKVCIVGVGAIGGLLGAKLAAAGRAQVSAIARGNTLQAMRRHGWRLNTAQGVLTVPAQVTDNPNDVGIQDLVIIAVKAHALTAASSILRPMLGRDTIILPAMNGVPWWFCHGIPEFRGTPLQSVDPGGVVGSLLDFDRVLGCVVHMSASCPEVGVVQHQHGLGLRIGEPAGGLSDRTQCIADMLCSAGFEATPSGNIRHDIWYKLWGNLTLNPLSAITGATLDRVLSEPGVRAFCRGAMREAAAIGSVIDCDIREEPEARLDMAERLGAFKTSMLQDVEAGRHIELDAIVAVVQEIGRKVAVATPHIDTLVGLTKLFARQRNLY